jgi:2-methylcitrate dehydratase
VLGLGRRDVIKLGAGVVLTTLAAPRASAQAPAPGSPRPPGEPRPHSGPYYKNDYNRLGNNGPMDDTTRQIVSWVHSFSEADLSEPLVRALNRTMVDSMAALIAGFEMDAVRIAARMARQASPNELKSTVLGYGVTTTPELAAFANSCMVRHSDFNDSGPGGKCSNYIPAVLAIGEALHSTGGQVMAAITIVYELGTVPAGGGGESVCAAMGAGKLMGLNEDQLANAVSIALTPHVTLNKGVGAMSMWKGVRSAEPVKCGVWAALLAREGMTGPPQPFEGRGGLWDVFGRGRKFTLPELPGSTVVERNEFKYWPADGVFQATLDLLTEMRAWTKVDEIASIQYDMTLGDWEECGGSAKWDPRNQQTADHSVPYALARGLIDGYIYLDSYTPEKFMDPAARALMAKMTLAPVQGWTAHGAARITIRKNSGEERSFDTLSGLRVANDRRNLTSGGCRHPDRGPHNIPMTDADITEKFNRVCAYRQVTNEQRDRARDVWGNLRAVKDIGEAIRTLATFGKPLPL